MLLRLGGQETRSRQDGLFKFQNIPSGPHQLLEVIGRDQITLPGRWPNLSYDIDILSGIENRVGRPIFLPRVNPGITLPLNANDIVTQDTYIELPVIGGEPPIQVTVREGTKILFPPDITDKRFSITTIPADKVPMALEDGRATQLYISVQPSGAIFDPPLEVTFPNIDGGDPASLVLLMSFDHDAGRYVQVGTGHVSTDGKTIRSDAGSGIRIGAWHGFPPVAPQPPTDFVGGATCDNQPSRIAQLKNSLISDRASNLGCVECDVSFCSVPALALGGGFYRSIVYGIGACFGIAANCKPSDDFSVNLTVFNGQGGSQIQDSDKSTKGAFTIANLNDTNGDGTLDKDQPSVIQTQDGIDEIDLMKLTISRPELDKGVPLQLRVVSGAISLWEKPTKEVQVTDLNFAYSDLPKTIWIEATAPSMSERDIILEAEYSGKTDTIKATALNTTLSIFNGQNGQEVELIKKETVGAFTIPNINDTNGDGIIDLQQNPVKSDDFNWADEEDLIKLIINKPIEQMVTPLNLNITGDIVLWDSPTKNNLEKRQSFSNTDLPITLWIEARSVSPNLRNIRYSDKVTSRKEKKS